ncbi:response regulator transcription factor [Vibrio sp. S4M6]|uniref:response regulator transcription factor n=1 Tax=Vibrio sinus TaxID=2946865 RepID=UPI00202A5733|nr:response regulator transcription factor [Vibrio sinus]MCL9780266.1 response regulator transcription factor [Vibrio sinus]
MKLLLVEDDLEIAGFITKGFFEQGHSIFHETEAKTGLIRAASEHFDVIIFDRMLPGMDGIDAVRVLRQSQVYSPVLILTAKDSIGDRVAGLEAGADDYMVKPFAFEELNARVKALARRQPFSENSTQLTAGPLTLDKLSRKVTHSGIELELLPREYQILELLLSNQGELVTKTMLLEQVWGFQFDPNTSLVQTHVSRLRNKVDKAFNTELIKTVRGAGYVLSF